MRLSQFALSFAGCEKSLAGLHGSGVVWRKKAHLRAGTSLASWNLEVSVQVPEGVVRALGSDARTPGRLLHTSRGEVLFSEVD